MRVSGRDSLLDAREELRQAVEWLPLLLLLLPPRTSEVAETRETNGISQREPMKLILVQVFKVIKPSSSLMKTFFSVVKMRM